MADSPASDQVLIAKDGFENLIPYLFDPAVMGEA